jgi:hypothetical protein
MTFRFLPPSPEESRAFLAQLGATLLSFVVIGVLFWRSNEAGLRAVLIGAGIGTLFLLARAAWKLELKAARAQRGSLAIDGEGFTLSLDANKTHRVAWHEITNLEVRGGKLHVAWTQSGYMYYIVF